MGRYNTKRLLKADVSQIDAIAEAIREEFENDGFDVMVDDLLSCGKDISITKGGMFKAVLGMRSALKVTLTPQSDGVLFDANVGIFGQQVIPSVITLFFFWPVLIIQIWGLVKQSKIDDRALAIAQAAARESAPAAPTASTLLDHDVKFCTHCGHKMSRTAKFCPECGEKMIM